MNEVSDTELWQLYTSFYRQAHDMGCEYVPMARDAFHESIQRLTGEERGEWAEKLRKGFKAAIPGQSEESLEEIQMILDGKIPPRIIDLVLRHHDRLNRHLYRDDQTT